MRGPGIRLNHDVRRLWRCPLCHNERRLPATETVVHCHCHKDRPQMKLVEHQRKHRGPASPVDLYMTYDDLFPEEAPHPVAETGTEELGTAIPLPPEVREELGDDPFTDEEKPRS